MERFYFRFRQMRSTLGRFVSVKKQRPRRREDAKSDTKEEKEDNSIGLFLRDFLRGLVSSWSLPALLIMATMLAGCVAERPALIQESARALNSNQPEQAISAAQEYLDKNPTGTGAAEAWYLIGQGYEAHGASSSAQAASNLQMAHAAYVRGLALAENGIQQGHFRAGLANVEFFMGNYSAALQEWSTAYNLLTDPDVRAWTLYRIGLCRQRLGRFTEADRTFAMVQQNYPGTAAAARAAEKSGYRDFYVQIGVYANQSNAWAALSRLRGYGVGTQLFRNAQGQHVLCAGPSATYAQARTLQAKLIPHYPGAIIVP